MGTENSLSYHHYIKVIHRNVFTCIVYARDIFIYKVTTVITTHSINSKILLKKFKLRESLENSEGKQTWVFISRVNTYFNYVLVKACTFLMKEKKIKQIGLGLGKIHWEDKGRCEREVVHSPLPPHIHCLASDP